MTAPPPARSPASALALGASTTIVCILPAFLTGALAVQLTGELRFGPAALGFAVAMFRATGAALSPVFGRATDRLGSIQAVRIACLIAITSGTGIAFFAHRWSTLLFWLMVGGCAHAFGQPASNRLLATAIAPGRLGTAFGIKQSAPPASSMLAGLSVPVLALTLGWRSTYIVAAGLALVVLLAAGRRPPREHRRPRPSGPLAPLGDRRLLVLFAVTFGLGTWTNSTATTFYVDSAVSAGTTQQFAGTMLAASSIIAILVRLSAGWASDRFARGHLLLCAALLSAGALGMLLLATGRPTTMAVGVVIAIGAGWGYNGVFWFALIRAYPQAPGRITGVLAPGALLGSTFGPIVFGAIADLGTYGVAWTATAAVAVAACAMMVLGARLLPDPPRQDPPAR